MLQLRSAFKDGTTHVVTALFLKDVEKLTARKIGATLLVIAGVFFISWEKL